MLSSALTLRSSDIGNLGAQTIQGTYILIQLYFLKQEVSSDVNA